MASRAQLVTQVIRPALANGATVLCDRFVSSTCAYQGAAGLDPKRVIELARYAIGDCWPDATVLIDVDVDEGFDRIGRKSSHAGKNRTASDEGPMLFEGSKPDAMEARPIDFHRRVREVFRQLDAYYPSPVVMIDGGGDEEAVHARIVEGLGRVFS
jgi:dTMP kinase